MESPAGLAVRCRSGRHRATLAITLGGCCIDSNSVLMNGIGRKVEMPTFAFTLIVDGPDLQDTGVVDALFEAGCDDALVGSSDGVQFLDFDREADTLGEAVLSAVGDVESVGELSVTRIADAGLITMAEIAARVGRTRESIRLLVAGKRGPGGFPPPATDPRSRYRLWRAGEVEHWMKAHLGEAFEWREDLFLTALNLGLEFRHHRAHLSDAEVADIRTLVDL